METTNLTIEQIDADIERLEKILSEKDSKWDFSKSFEEYQEYLEPEQSKLWRLNQIKRMIMPYTLEELPDYGDVMSLEHFIENVKCGGFIDYDGHGYYVKDGKETNIMIHPSDVKEGAIRTEFDTIIWYNR